MYTLPFQPFRDCRIIIFEGGFWARGLEYELIDDFCYTLIVIRTLGHMATVLAGKALECRTQDRKFGGSIPPYDLWEFLQPKFDAECGLRYE